MIKARKHNQTAPPADYQISITQSDQALIEAFLDHHLTRSDREAFLDRMVQEPALLDAFGKALGCGMRANH